MYTNDGSWLLPLCWWQERLGPFQIWHRHKLRRYPLLWLPPFRRPHQRWHPHHPLRSRPRLHRPLSHLRTRRYLRRPRRPRVAGRGVERRSAHCRAALRHRRAAALPVEPVEPPPRAGGDGAGRGGRCGWVSPMPSSVFIGTGAGAADARRGRGPAGAGRGGGATSSGCPS